MRIKRIVLYISIICVIAFSSVGLFLESKAQRSDIELRAQEEFVLLTTQISLKLHSFLMKNEQNLSGTARIIAGMSDGDQNEKKDILISLSESAEKLEWLDVMYCDRNGKGYSIDGFEYDISFCPYYKRALLGDVTTTQTLYKAEDDERLSYVCTVPILQNGYAIGALRACIKPDQIQSRLSISNYRGKEAVYLLSRNSDIIACTDSTNELKNFISQFKTDSEEYIQFEQVIRQGRQLSMMVGDEFYSTTGIPDSGEWGIVMKMDTDTLYSFYTNYSSEEDLNIAMYLFMAVLAIACATAVFGIIETGMRYKMQRLAYFDEITESMNFNLFRMSVTQHMNKNTGALVAIIEMGINKYEYLKDFFGDKEIDRILCEIAAILASNVKKNEYYCHNFGEMFYMYVQYHSQDELRDRIKYMNESIESLNRVEGEKNKYTLSVAWGVCCRDKEKIDIETMLNRVSLAYMSVKGNREGNILFYTEKMQNRMLDEREIENDMFDALENKEFLVYLQPKFDLKTGYQVGAEALVRWMHPEKGLMYPGRFISTFEKNGFIVRIDMYILEELCRRIKVWISKGFRPSPLSLNISRLNLYDEDFVNEAVSIVESYGVPHNLIIFEISEEVVAENMDKLSEVMTSLKDQDFGVSMDDFGTGGTSLNTLYYVPVTELKIDRKFLLNAEKTDRGQNVIQSIIEMAKRLEINVVSEGVENKQQAILLREMGCDMIQGFAFSEPLPEHEYDEYAFGARARENSIW